MGLSDRETDRRRKGDNNWRDKYAGNSKKKCVGAQRDSVPLGAITQGGLGGRLGRLHNVGPLKRLSRGRYVWQQQRGYKWDVVTEVGAAD